MKHRYRAMQCKPHEQGRGRNFYHSTQHKVWMRLSVRVAVGLLSQGRRGRKWRKAAEDVNLLCKSYSSAGGVPDAGIACLDGVNLLRE